MAAKVDGVLVNDADDFRHVGPVAIRLGSVGLARQNLQVRRNMQAADQRVLNWDDVVNLNHKTGATVADMRS